MTKSDDTTAAVNVELNVESPDPVGATENSPGCNPGSAIVGATSIVSTLFPFALFHPRELSALFAAAESRPKPNPPAKKKFTGATTCNLLTPW
jgi:hypothetical protein